MLFRLAVCGAYKNRKWGGDGGKVGEWVFGIVCRGGRGGGGREETFLGEVDGAVGCGVGG